jgi:hypothetical protein
LFRPSFIGECYNYIVKHAASLVMYIKLRLPVLHQTLTPSDIKFDNLDDDDIISTECCTRRPYAIALEGEGYLTRLGSISPTQTD